MSPLVKLPSGTVIDVSSVRMIARQDINKYIVFFDNMTSQAIITGEDLDALVAKDLVSVLLA